MSILIETEGKRFEVDLSPEVSDSLFEELISKIVKKDNSLVSLRTNTKKSSTSKYDIIDGSFIIQCAICGETNSFEDVSLFDKYYCHGCGGATDISNLITKIIVKCDCGQETTFLTNLKDDKILCMECTECNSSFFMEYNYSTNKYEIIR